VTCVTGQLTFDAELFYRDVASQLELIFGVTGSKCGRYHLLQGLSPTASHGASTRSWSHVIGDESAAATIQVIFFH